MLYLRLGKCFWNYQNRQRKFLRFQDHRDLQEFDMQTCWWCSVQRDLHSLQMRHQHLLQMCPLPRSQWEVPRIDRSVMCILFTNVSHPSLLFLFLILFLFQVHWNFKQKTLHVILLFILSNYIIQRWLFLQRYRKTWAFCRISQNNLQYFNNVKLNISC